jgi:hypothetical protein
MAGKPRDQLGGFGDRGNGSGSAMPRQITKNPLNMLGGMGSDRGGGYSNGSSSGGGGGSRWPEGNGGGFGGGGVSAYDRGNGSSGKIGEGPKGPQQGNNGSGYTTDGYGMGAMGSR